MSATSLLHEGEELKATCAANVRGVLSLIRFAPSCVDMGWKWEVEECGVGEARFWRIRTTFQRPDTHTGIVATGYGRWWVVDFGTTESGIVKTAFAAAKMILEHELMEAFTFDGVRIFDPHTTVEALASTQSEGGWRR